MKEFICPVCGCHTQGTERNEEVLNVMNLIGAVAGGPEHKAYCENCGNTFPVVDDIYEIVEITNVDGTAKTDERALARIGRKIIIGELKLENELFCHMCQNILGFYIRLLLLKLFQRLMDGISLLQH